MRALLAALVTIVAALGLQLAMVVGVLRPNLFLAFLGYSGLFAGAVLIIPTAFRRAQTRLPSAIERGAHSDPRRKQRRLTDPRH